MHFPVFRAREAHLCNGVEENKQKLVSSNDAVIVPYKPNSYITVRLKTSARPESREAVARWLGNGP